ncbi:MAG TPA: helicase-related protein [Herpetosiphonaceae bacterium]|nr:helicase-related protein [Herpetosiphonaceae bacterium]
MASSQQEDYFDKADLLGRGWTDSLIERFLGDADRDERSRSDPGGAPRLWYWKDRVLAHEQDATVERALRRAAQRRARKLSTGRHMRQRDFSLFKEYFPRARALERRFVYFCGPTNSGKTYHALNALCRHTSGVYLAPLRLLALEGQEEIERRGKLCSLLTGDERDLKPDALFRAQTIESLNYDEEVEAILIDEVQMLVDDQRGEHWVSALIGAPAATIYLAGSPEALAYIQQVCAYVDGSLEIHTMERLTPLHVDSRKRSLAEALAPKGQKAFIVFSRQAVFDLKDAVDEHGQRAAVIYGSLGPAVRRKEAERFRSGECPVLIATDAIGMGLNLPIDRLYFVATQKWDGTQERPLTPSELRQIAGRAGRYKKSKTGLVGAVFQADLDRVRRVIETPPSVLTVRRLRLGLPLPLAQELAHLRNTEALAKVMEFFSVMKDSSGLFQPQVQPQVIRLAALLDEYPSLTFDVKYRLAFAPVNTDDPVLFDEYRYHIERLARHRRLSFVDDTDDTVGTLTLIEAERLVKLYTLRLWFAFQYADVEDIELLEQRRDAANAAIEGFLRAKAKLHRRRCRVCERVLPRFSSYGLCERCFSGGRRA